MYLGDNLKKVYDEDIQANAVFVKPYDFDTVLFENIPVEGGAIIGNSSPGINITSDFNKTIFFKATQSFVVSVQVTDDDGDSPQWFDLCDWNGVVITFTLSGNGTDAYARAIPVYIKAYKMRVIAMNDGLVSDTPYCAVM